ncbi:MAG: hypothetical protein QOG63_2631 [Thermoleophilaceae bacterium]|jgi:hypothetical protein|nr:hypothetical protein [Thermoleophilaceae bacterium]
MLARIRPHLNHATVVAYLALFAALGGGAYAAIKLPKNSVGSKQIKRDAVTSAKIRNGTLTATDAQPGQFAVPADLGNFLPAGATAVNSNALGGVGPGGFVQGGGHRLSADVSGLTQTTDLVPVPGGGAIKINCGTFGYDFGFKEPAGGTHAYDLFEDVAVASSSQQVFYRRLQPDSSDPGSTPGTQPVRATFDISSDAGYVQVTAFGRYDSATNSCSAKVRGFSNP